MAKKPRREVKYKGKKYKALTNLVNSLYKKDKRKYYSRIIHRLNQGMSVADAVEKPLYTNIKEPAKNVEFEGNRYHSIKELGEAIGIPHYTIYSVKNKNGIGYAEAIKKIRERKNKETIKGMCKKLGISRQWYYYLKERGVWEEYKGRYERGIKG